MSLGKKNKAQGEQERRGKKKKVLLNLCAGRGGKTKTLRPKNNGFWGQKEKGFRISASRFPSAIPVGCAEEERSLLHLGGAKRTARRCFCSKTPEFSPNSPWRAGSAAAPSLLSFLPRSPAPREHRAWLPPTWGGDPWGLLLSSSREHCLKTSLKTKKKKTKRGKK